MIFITQSVSDAASKAIADGITAGLILLGLYLLFALAFLVGIVALVTWVVKLVWYGGRKHKKVKKSDDWLYNAQSRQNNTYEYSDPIIHHSESNQKKNKIRWDGEARTRKDGRKVSPTGWTFNEETQLWEPPEHLK